MQSTRRRLGQPRPGRGARLRGRADVRRRARADRRLADRPPDPRGERIAASLADDPLVATLLLIHDLHPVPLEQRVQAALDSVRPYMESHGGNVELLSLEDGVARIHLRGSCSDCSASSVTLELAIKQALEEAAPDLEGLEVEGVAPQTAGGPGLPMATGTAPTGIELPMVMSGAPATPSWFDVDAVGELADGALAAVTVAGSDLLVANVEGTLLAYRDRCAGCGAHARTTGLLSAGALACPSCARSFFLPRAGRSMDDDRLQLEPVPLLRENGRVKVALAAMNDGRAGCSTMRSRRAGGRELVSGLRGLAPARPRADATGPRRPPGTRGTATCAASAFRRITGTCSRSRERRIVCACEACWAMRSGEGDYRPTGNRTLWLPDSTSPTSLWASFQIPIGLAFFMESTVTSCVVAMYPSPGGATECELHFESWSRMRRAQPGARRTRARHRGADRQPARGSAALRDRADRPLLRAHRHDQGALGGDLGRRRRRGGGERVLRGAARAGGPGVSVEIGTDSLRPDRAGRSP